MNRGNFFSSIFCLSVLFFSQQNLAMDDEASKLYKEAVALQESAPNLDENFIHFKNAADRGSTDAQFLVGSLYSIGYGVDKNLDEGKKYLALAAGDDRARTRLECVNQKINDAH